MRPLLKPASRPPPRRQTLPPRLQNRQPPPCLRRGEAGRPQAPPGSAVIEVDGDTATARSGIREGGKYKGKALLVSGTVDSISSDFMDKPVVQLSAKPFGFVQASDLPKDVAASLKKGQKVTLACTGNGEVIGFPALSGCTVQ